MSLRTFKPTQSRTTNVQLSNSLDQSVRIRSCRGAVARPRNRIPKLFLDREHSRNTIPYIPIFILDTLASQTPDDRECQRLPSGFAQVCVVVVARLLATVPSSLAQVDAIPVRRTFWRNVLTHQRSCVRFWSPFPLGNSRAESDVEIVRKNAVMCVVDSKVASKVSIELCSRKVLSIL